MSVCRKFPAELPAATDPFLLTPGYIWFYFYIISRNKVRGKAGVYNFLVFSREGGVQDGPNWYRVIYVWPLRVY